MQNLNPQRAVSPRRANPVSALHPAAGNWLYYVTVDPATGKTDFTNSYQTFLQLKREFEASKG